MKEWLPEDVICEILCRLPIKTMIGFKCVCKTWNSLVSNICVPRISRGIPLSGFLFYAENLSDRKHRFINCVPYLPNGTGHDFIGERFLKSYCSLVPSDISPSNVVDCCNGLILLVNQSVPRYYVCNPATKQCVGLPNPSGYVTMSNAALAFNPSQSSHYKVVRFIYERSFSASNPARLDIFSSETGKWTNHELVLESPAYGVSWLRRTVYLDGMLYKLTLSKHLLHFNLQTLTVQAIELPCTDKTDNHGSIGVSKGALFYANRDEDRILVWQFDFYGKARHYWILQDCICVYDLLVNDPAGWYEHVLHDSSNFLPFAFHPSSDIIFIGTPRMILSYRLRSQKLEVFYNRRIYGEICLGHLYFYPYRRCFCMLSDVS